MKIHWKDSVEQHDFDAANDYLHLVSDRTISPSRHVFTPLVQHPAKDILRASTLPLLPEDNVHVEADLHKLRNGEDMSPIILIRGVLGVHPLVIADGYHRVCAAYHHDENADIPALLIN